MSKFSLNTLMEGKNPYKVLLEETRGLVRKWEPTGLLEGMRNESDVHGMSILLENQARQLIDEGSRTGTSEGNEEWAGVALPLVRRVFGEIAAKEFVSVQPMNLPSGLVFYLDFKYGSNRPGFNKGDSLFGKTNVPDLPTGGLYGAGRFAYTINDKSLNDLDGVVVAVTARDVQFDATLAASGTLAKLRKVTVDLAGQRIDTNGVRAFTLAAEAGPAAVIEEYFPRFTAYEGDNKVSFIYKLNAAAIAAAGTTTQGRDIAFTDTLTVQFHAQPLDYDRGDFEDRSASNLVGGTNYTPLDIPEIDVQLRSEPIVAKTRKLKAVWTPELAQDLNAYHSVDAEAELTSILSEYISMEIDLEILDMLVQNGLTREYWSTLPGMEYDANTGAFANRNSHTGTKNEWYQTLGNKIQRVSNRIHQKTMRGGANFMVCSPDVATIIESIPGYLGDTDGTQATFAMGVQKIGALNNRFTVYKNPYMLDNIILVGFRGNNFLETGAVYAPYVPLIMTPLIYDPNSFTPRRGVMTRYAKKMVRPEFYGIVVVSNPEYV